MEYSKLVETYEKLEKTLDEQFEMLKKLELSYANFQELKKYCNKKNIMFMSTPDETESADFLFELQDIFKIGNLAGIERHDGLLRGQSIFHAAAIIGQGIEQPVAVSDHHLLDGFVGPGALGCNGQFDAGLGRHGVPVPATDLGDTGRPKLQILSLCRGQSRNTPGRKRSSHGGSALEKQPTCKFVLIHFLPL